VQALSLPARLVGAGCTLSNWGEEHKSTEVTPVWGCPQPQRDSVGQLAAPKTVNQRKKTTWGALPCVEKAKEEGNARPVTESQNPVAKSLLGSAFRQGNKLHFRHKKSSYQLA